MKKMYLASVLVAIVILATYKLSSKINTNANITFIDTTISSSYREYAFDSGDDLDLGFTKRAYTQLKASQPLLDAGSDISTNNQMVFSKLSLQDKNKGIIDRYTWGDDHYELAQDINQDISGSYRMLFNDTLLFEANMDFGTDGPILDWRIVNEKPAFTFRSHCDTNENNQVTCDHDIWYDDGLISQKYSVENPRYLFSFAGKIGFVASNHGADAIFYDGKFITPDFDTIWTHNCCSYSEILPTVYENGVLLFYAKRNETTYLVETLLN